MDWSGSVEGPVDGPFEHGNEFPDSINAGRFLSSYTTGGFSRRARFIAINKEIG
jgi:hypothetical protein